MRILLITALVSVLACAAACNKQQVAGGSGHAPGFSKSQFVSIASGEQLGGAWSGGASGLHGLFADAEGNHALLVTRGQPGTLMLLDRPDANKLTDLGSAEVEPQYVDFGGSKAFGVRSAIGQAPILESRGLAGDSPWTSLGSLGESGASQCLAMAGSSKAGQVWALLSATVAEPSIPVQPAQMPGNLSRQNFALYRSDGVAAPVLVAEYTQVGESREIGEDNLAVLADGSACFCQPDSGSLEIAHSDGVKFSYSFPKGYQAMVSADKTQPLVWLYILPDNSGEGTGRSHVSCQVGRLIVVDTNGQEVASAGAGSVPFDQIAGDFANRRCLLAQSKMGVAEASLPAPEGDAAAAPAQINWLLRHGGDSKLYLLASGDQLWTAFDDGIYGISADGLRKQAPNLSAATALPRKAALPARAAAEALGWDWAATQISPLAGIHGKLTLFDSADPNSSWAEMDWSAKGKRAERVLVVRTPKKSDSDLRSADDATVEKACMDMLSALGWPGAKLTTDGIARDEFNLQATYELAEAKDGASPGQFSLWITDAATLMTLETMQSAE